VITRHAIMLGRVMAVAAGVALFCYVHWRRILLGLGFVVFAFWLFLQFVIADAWGHWQYEMQCCNLQDCKPVADSVVTETPAGFELHDIPEFVERTSAKVRKPINEEYHVCRNAAGALLCIYPKLQGM
jgi:hypothetical protein